MTRSDSCLQRVRATRAAEFFGTLKRGKTTADEQLIPQGAILVEQQDGLSRGARSRAGARRLDFHQRHEAVDLRLLGSKLCQYTAETESFFAEGGSHPVITSSR